MVETEYIQYKKTNDKVFSTDIYNINQFIIVYN